MNKQNEGLQFLLSNNRLRLVHGVLKGLGISPFRDDYPDLVQEGCLIFAEAFADFKQKGTSDNEAALMHYAYQKVRWRLLDYLRHQQHACQLTAWSLNDDNQEAASLEKALIDPAGSHDYDHLENAGFFALLDQHCRPSARRYLRACLADRAQTDSEIAVRYGVTRQAVHQWKQALIADARRLRTAGML